MKAPPGYERGCELTYQIVLQWTHRDGPPQFRFPPRDVALCADLRSVGTKLAVNDSARDLVAKLIVDVKRETGEAPTAMMLRVVLRLCGLPIQWVPIEELGLGKIVVGGRGQA